MGRLLLAALLAACLIGCTTADDASTSTSTSASAGSGAPDAGGCAPGEATLKDGTCVPAGVPANACAAGFVADGKAGCRAVLPPSPCDKGQMAVPGETACHDVDDCGTGTYGTIPIGAKSQLVDAS